MRYSITVCMDGHVSVIDKQDPTVKPAKQRRLNSALPMIHVDDILVAVALVSKLCVINRVHHGGKTGTLLEPMVIGWPTKRDATLTDLDYATRLFEEEYARMQAVAGPRYPGEGGVVVSISRSQGGKPIGGAR